jgi:hypothetical protein
MIYIIVSHSPMGSVLGVKTVTPAHFDDYEQQHGDTVIVIDNGEVIRHWTYYA